MIKLLLIISFILIISCKKEGIAQILPKAPKMPKFQVSDSVDQERVNILIMKWQEGMDKEIKRVGEEARDN